MSNAPSQPATLRRAVARQFAYRPTLRNVLSEAFFKVVATHYPGHAAEAIDHHQSEPYTLVRPGADGTLQPERLLSLLLDAYVQGYVVAFGASDKLKFRPFAEEYLDYTLEGLSGNRYDAGQGSSLLALAPLNDDLNAVLATLLVSFQKAQVRFWNEDDAITPDVTGVSRHAWMRQVLRVALLGNISYSNLGSDERNVLYDMLLGMDKGLSVSVVELDYQVGDETFSRLLPGLLLEAEREERSLVVLCVPSGLFQAFASLQDFEQYLHRSEVPLSQFDRLDWRRRTFQGDPFQQQSGLLLNSLLQDLERVRLSSLTSREALEQVMAEITDPSRYFLDDAFFGESDTPSSVPDWLNTAASEDRFAYQVAMLDLAIAQTRWQGRSSLEGVQSLQAYAARRLREVLLEDYPVEANYFPDDLVLHLSIPDPTVDPELPVQLRAIGSMSLTQFAIDRLKGLQDAVITQLTHRDEQLIMNWMTPTYVVDLVERVDVGGAYPGYVEALLAAPEQRAERIERFTLEWRSALFFDGLKAKVDGVLDAECWQALAEFCRSRRDLKSNIDLSPLGFRAQEGDSQRDVATCMYVIEVQRPQALLLYRPLYRDAPLMHFADRAALMAALAQSGELQDSVLHWLPDSVFRVYANGGFLEPHLRRVIFDTSLWPQPVQPVSLWLKPFKADIDTWLFEDKRQALQVLADRQSTSNSEERWHVIGRFAWLLFDFVTPLLRGPVGAVAWVVGMLEPWLEQDDAPQVDGAGAVKAVNLLASFALVLMHARLPNTHARVMSLEAAPISLGEPASRTPLQLPQDSVEVVHEPTDQVLQAWAGHVALGHGWGPGPVQQRRMLLPYKAEVDLAAGVLVDGLSLLDGRRYVTLYGEPYEVQVDEMGRRVVGPAGEKGPLLYNDGQWRIRVDGFGLGGAPVGRRQAQARFDALNANINVLSARIVSDNSTSTGLNITELEALTTLQNYYALKENTESNKASLSSADYERLMAGVVGKIETQALVYEQAVSRYVDSVEGLVDLCVQLVAETDEILDLLKRPRVTSDQVPQYFIDTRATARDTAIRLCRVVLARLPIIAGYPKIRALSNDLHGRVIEGELLAKYRDYRQGLEHLVGIQARLVKASALMDRFIPEVPANTVMIPEMAGQPEIRIEWIKYERTLTTVDFLFQQAMHYSDLAINFDQEDPLDRLPGYYEQLMGTRLRAAAYAHGEVSVGNLDAADRIEVLQVAWDEYSAALINLVDIKRDADDNLVNLPMFERYAQTLQALKDDAGKLIAGSVGEEEGGGVQMMSAYVPSETPRGVVRARNGQILVGDLVTVEGETFLNVCDPATKAVLQQFKRVGQAWVDVAAEPEVVPPSAADAELTTKALKILGKDVAVQEKAQEYVDNNVSHHLLEQLVEAHVSKLRGFEQAFEGQQTPTALLLRQRLGEWTVRLQSLLVTLYSKTPYPDAEALRYLHEKGLLRVAYNPPRKTLADDSAMDEYIIRLLPKPDARNSRPLWVAHFHFNEQADNATDFTRGHLKTWAQRHYGPEDAKKLAKQNLRIHRGPLTLAQAQGIIPFY
ncbi:dermonecrotic toxin domain-containing protein [Pseudomonas sp. NPDC089554]|uniref:dermonecrotic toxin domain-containing protein n=1 Tax=Pseudomonas sp. NPDC089554 TaxID=3390653 RepID=UPI003D00418A